MDNNLILFEDASIQQKTWHVGLSNELQATLRQRAVNIKVISLQATLAIAKELTEAQKELLYKNGGFVKWCEEEVGIDFQRAYEFITIWESYKMFPESGNILGISKTVLLDSSKKDVPQSAREEIVERHKKGETITIAASNEIIERHKAEANAANQRAEESEKKAASSQQKLDLFSQLSEGKIGELNKQITDLQEKIETLSTPEKVEVTPQAVLNDIAAMKAQIEKLTEQKALLSKKSTELADDLKKERAANKAQREQERYEAQIKDSWKKATDELYKALSKFNGQLPSPIDQAA